MNITKLSLVTVSALGVLGFFLVPFISRADYNDNPNTHNQNSSRALNSVAEKTPKNNEQTVSTNSTLTPKIQIAILLDSSNSMDGLIEQTRTQIWKLVNAISKVTKNDKPAILEVSLYHYGNNSLPSSEGFNRMLNQLTTDLDLVSEKLFSIQTNGGQEYAGWVIKSAITELQWSDNSQDFRVIFIAGNEGFDQGSVHWQQSIDVAVNRDVIVNTIYCGESENSESRLWANAANDGKGSYFNLNQDQKIISISTPYDEEIAQLNRELNATYIPYGSQGDLGYQRQQLQDSNAFSESNSAAGLNRTTAKASSNYRNSSWDLVDAVTDNTVDLSKLGDSSLPENMRPMSVPKRIEYIEEIKQKRQKIRAKIAEFAKKREDYIVKNTPNSEQQNTLDSLMIETLRKQLEAKGFNWN